MEQEKHYKKLSELLSKEQGEGHSIVWHIKNGSQAYKKIFLAILEEIEKKDMGTISISAKSLYRKTSLPSNACQYALYKFQEAGMIYDSKTSRTRIFLVEHYMRKTWNDVCEIIRENT